MKKKHVISMYGSVSLERGYCNNCKAMAIIKGGFFQCCDARVEELPNKFERVSEPFYKRKTPTKFEKDKILSEQENKRFYCGAEFDSIKFRNGTPFLIKIEWDHKLPFVYSQNNDTLNFVAACHVCNRIKHDTILQTVEEAQVYLADRRKSKGYSF